MVQLLTIVVYLLLLNSQLGNAADQLSNPFILAWNLLVPWVGALIARFIFLRIDAAVNGLLNSHRVMKTAMDRQAVLDAVAKVVAEYDYRSTRFQLTNQDEGSGQLSGRWNARIDWLRFLLFLTPWEMSLSNQSIEVTVDIEVTGMSGQETEVDIRFTNEADPPSVDWPGYIVRLQLLSLIQTAVACQRTVLLSDPRKDFSRYEQVTTLLYEGRAHYNKGKFKRALKWFKNATLVKPDCVDTWRWLAKTLESLDRSDEAIAAYERALGLDPKIEVMWLDYAAVLTKQGKSEEAAEAFRKAFAAGLDEVPAAKVRTAAVTDHFPQGSPAEETKPDLTGSAFSFVGA